MFTLPSMWNLIISTIAFIIAAWYVRRYLEESGLPHGMTRGMLVFLVAFFVSWCVGEGVDWVQEKIEGPQPAAANSDDLAKLLNELGKAQR